MNANEKLVYTTAQMNAEMIIAFMRWFNFYDKELEDKLADFIEKIKEKLYYEC